MVANDPPRAATPKWGTLDIKRADLPLAPARPVAQASQLRAAMPSSPPAAHAGLALEHAPNVPHPALAGHAAAQAGRAKPGRPASAPLERAAVAGVPVRPGARAVSRALSAPLAADSQARPRPASGPLAIAQGGAALPQGRAQLDLPPLAAAAPENENHLETGMLEIDGAFSAALPEGPALEMASLSPARRAPESPRPAGGPPQPAERERPRSPVPPSRARRVHDLARYGQAPPHVLGAIPYFLRVYSRRRVLESQLAALTQQRKKLEIASDDALCVLGQALHARRSDPALRPLAPQLRVIGEAAHDAGARAAAAKRTESELGKELEALERQLLEAERSAAPEQAREAELAAQLEALAVSRKRTDMLLRKADAERKALRASSDGSAADRLEQLEIDLTQLHAQRTAQDAELAPIEQALSAARARLTDALARVRALAERRDKLRGAIGREQERGRISSGSMHSAYRDALRSLAFTALRGGLAEQFAPDEAKAAARAGELASAHRESEELMRAAVSSYDHPAYQRGQQLLVASVVALFLLFLGLIAL